MRLAAVVVEPAELVLAAAADMVVEEVEDHAVVACPLAPVVAVVEEVELVVV